MEEVRWASAELPDLTGVKQMGKVLPLCGMGRVVVVVCGVLSSV